MDDFNRRVSTDQGKENKIYDTSSKKGRAKMAKTATERYQMPE